MNEKVENQLTIWLRERY